MPSLQRLPAQFRLRPRLITLDAFDTIYYPYPDVPTQYKQFVQQHAPESQNVRTDDIQRNFYAAFKRAAVEHPNYGRHTSLPSPREWWHLVIRETLEPYFTGERPLTEAAIDELYELFYTARAYRTHADVPAFVDKVKVPLGVISNSDPRTREVLMSLGLATPNGSPRGFALDRVVCSYEAEAEKPDPRIFTFAATNAAATVGPTRPGAGVQYVHIGDEFRKDVAPMTDPALAAWAAVYLCREGPPADWTVPGDFTGVFAIDGNERQLCCRSLADLVDIFEDRVE
ncbi:uncharacterized protein V1510DRAFT_375563 [Dipodascopsis tothii]|uniref:uncharacterized protein n=1 Tax=Dipodascopsis tothii TaxID=44089 RepID=UPI0034CDF12E